MAIATRNPSVLVLATLAVVCGCTPDQSVTQPAEPPPVKSTGAAGMVAVAGSSAPAVASAAPAVQVMMAGRSATSMPTGGAGKSAVVAGSGGMSTAGAGGAKVPAAAIGGSGGGGTAGRGAAGAGASGGSGGAAGDDGSIDPSDPTQSSGARDVNGPCKDLDLFCFDPFDMFIFNPECFTCNGGMGCQSCENFQAL